MERNTKKVSDSMVEQVFQVRPEHLNGAGRLFGGQLMAWIDEVAGLVGIRHSNGDVITASVDNLKFMRGAYLKDLIVLVGRITYVGHTSMDVRVDTYIEDHRGIRRSINRAYLTLVAVDENDKPRPVPGLTLENESEQAEWLGIVPDDFSHAVTVAEAAERFLGDAKRMTQVIYEDDLKLLAAMGASRRFGDLRLCGYVNQLDEEIQKQFSAVTVKLFDDVSCVVYRGTDKTVVGWREDCNMAFLSPVPSQRTTVEYLRQAAEQIAGTFLLCGHSKGGNLAIYAAATCERTLQDRILKVCSMDGPGFEPNVLELAGYNRMLSRMITYIPQNSVVGMLLEHREKYVVIRSMQEGFMQHDVYSWEVLGPSLIHEEGITDECRLLNASLKEWIDNMDYDQRRQFVNSLFDLLDECDAKTTDDLQNNWHKDIGRILTSIKKMDEANRKVVSQTILSLLKITRKNVSNRSED